MGKSGKSGEKWRKVRRNGEKWRKIAKSGKKWVLLQRGHTETHTDTHTDTQIHRQTNSIQYPCFARIINLYNTRVFLSG